MTALRFNNNNNTIDDEDDDNAYNVQDDDDELRLQKQWLELQRLLYCMERGGPAMPGKTASHDTHHAYHWREIMFRAEHCHALWQRLLQIDPQAQRLAQRVDQACRKAQEQVHQLRQAQQEPPPSQDQPVEEAMDVIDRIFGDHNHPKQQHHHHSQDDLADENSNENRNQPDDTLHDDDPYDGLLDDDEGDVDDQPYQPNQGGPEETPYNIQDFQKQQREQMEEAIALMAQQMKEATQGIQSQLQQQTSKTLTELETVAEQNVHDVAAVTQNVQQHNQRQQRRNWGTWTLLFTVVGVFVLCLVTIFTIPKRPNTCLVFCQQESSLIGLWVVQPVKVLLVQPITWLWQEYFDGTDQELSSDNGERDAEWSYLYDEDEEQRQEKEKLDQLLQSLKSGPPIPPRVKKVKTVDWREAMEDEVFDGWEAMTEELPTTKKNNKDPADNDETLSSQEDVSMEGDNEDEGEDDDDDGEEEEEDDDDDDEEYQHDDQEAEAETSIATEEEADMTQDDSKAEQDDAATVGAFPEDYATDVVQEPVGSVHEEPPQEQISSQDTQQLDDGEQTKEGMDGILSDIEQKPIDAEREETIDVDPIADQEPLSSDSNADSYVNRETATLEVLPDQDSGDYGTATQEVLPNGEMGTNPSQVVPETVHDVNMAALLASLNQAAQKTQEDLLVASETMVPNNNVPPLGSLGDTIQDTIPLGTAKPREGEAKTRISPRDVRHAADIGDVQRLQECLTLQPDFVDRSDKNQWTALHHAARSGHTEAIQLLYEHGASLSLENNRGNTALMEARIHLGDGHDAVKLLRQLAVEEDGKDGSSDGHQAKLQAKRNAIRLALETTIENDQDLEIYVKKGRVQLEQMTPKSARKVILEQVDTADSLDQYLRSGRDRLEAIF